MCVLVDGTEKKKRFQCVSLDDIHDKRVFILKNKHERFYRKKSTHIVLPVPRCLHCARCALSVFSFSLKKKKKVTPACLRVVLQNILTHKREYRYNSFIIRFFCQSLGHFFFRPWKRKEKKNTPSASVNLKSLLSIPTLAVCSNFARNTQMSELNGYIWHSMQKNGHTLLCTLKKKIRNLFWRGGRRVSVSNPPCCTDQWLRMRRKSRGRKK